jgi:hypothetical protein
MGFFEVVGIIITASVVVFVVLFLVYELLKKKAVAVIDAQGMPILRPIPIPTRNCPRGMRVLVWFFEVRRWTLSGNWTYTLKDGTRIILPDGFEFDGASIPRLFWGILSPVGLLLVPGLIHDYGYKFNQLWQLDDSGQVKPYMEKAGKSFWDSLFLDVGKEVNGFKLINFVAWLAVALGGSGAWDGHRKIEATPERPQVP